MIRLTRSQTKTAAFAVALLATLQLAKAAPSTNLALGITAGWRFTTNNVDAQNWKAPAYDDSQWNGVSNGLFYIETAALPAPANTPLPAAPSGAAMPCYYFRTSFQITNAYEVVALNFSNLVDDGAIFYLNGTEIQRVRMNAGNILYNTGANATPPGGDATAFQTFRITGNTLTNLVTGNNVLAVRVHQQAATTDDVVFGSEVWAVTDPDPTVQLLRGPYLQVCTPTSVVVRWRTDLPRGTSVVFGSSPAAIDQTNDLGGRVIEHEALVTNLSPDTLYYYGIGEAGKVIAGLDTNHFFRTYPLPGTPKPLHLWVLGDAGTANSSQQAVRNAFYQFNGTNHVDACLMLGDNAYSSGTDTEYQAAVFNMYSNMLRHTILWSTIGNHETYSTDPNGLYAYLNIFTMPTNGSAGGIPSGTKLYYSFDIGMVHFICLDSMVSSRLANAPMANWLRLDLAAATNRWLIAFWHHPAYTRGSHNSDSETELIQMRQNILPLLEAGGVDLVMAGHSHCYERSKLLNGHYGFSSTLTTGMVLNAASGRVTNGVGAYLKPETFSGAMPGNYGAVYMTAGSSGQVSGGTLNHPAMFISLNQLGSVVLDITSNRLDATFLRETSATNDWFSLIKTNFPPTASNLLYTVAAEASTNLQLAAADPNRDAFTFVSGTPPTNGLLYGFNPAAGTVFYTPVHGSTNGDAFTFAATDGKLTGNPALVRVTVLPPQDSDTNGLPNWWESQYGLTDPNGDADGDGASNLHEYRSGTNPTNSLSWLRITSIQKGASGFHLTWPGVGGVRYRILYADGLGAGGFDGQFTPLPRAATAEIDPDPPGTLGLMSFTDDFSLTGPPATGTRFYRLQVLN